MVYRPHVHTRPPIFSGAFNPVGSVWACDCGKVWTLTNGANGKTWREGRAPFPSIPTDDLPGALRFIREEANRHRRSLRLPQIDPSKGLTG